MIQIANTDRPVAMNTYHFKVDESLPVYSRAPDEKTAEARIKHQWPRSKVELVGVNMLTPYHQCRLPGHDVVYPSVGSKGEITELRPVSHHHKSESRPEGGYADAINTELAKTA